MHGASEADAALVIGALLAYPTFGCHEERELELGRELYRGDPTRVLQRARESRETMSIPTPEATQSPSGLNATVVTDPSWPRRTVGKGVGCCQSHKRTARSSPDDASSLPSWLKAIAQTPPSSTWRILHGVSEIFGSTEALERRAISQSSMVVSTLPEARTYCC